MKPPSAKRIFSGIQPSGELHLGNYLGALRQWLALQNAGNTCTYAIVDLHAITVPTDPAVLPENVLTTAASLLALGINPRRSTLLIQSHVSAHAEASWLLTTLTPVGELFRMTQYKEKAARQRTVAAGLLTYPILMASDILLHDTDLVPVGEDQLQHLEFTRTLARVFNRRFGKILREPAAYLLGTTARVMSLTDPTRKMSKSDPPASRIGLLDSADAIARKIRAAVTDSGTAINPDKLGPALTNLLALYAAVSDRTVSTVAEEFGGKSYAAFKRSLAELLIAHLSSFRTNAEDLLADRASLYRTLARGAEEAAGTAFATLARMKEHMGLVVGEKPRRP